ncbi:MAG: sulfur carrier protein ThiS [Planctomycetaceae bacterium]|nr:sulfur carrier protein ThiS [Planctomycetaceae bacterium]MBT6055308.1 sulfur carrier protein ThiS [Planctomycetaceae bacterium]
MVIFVNGQEKQVSTGHTAHDLLLLLGFEDRPVAVELNKEVVPRAFLSDRVLQEHDRVEVVTLVGGG